MDSPYARLPASRSGNVDMLASEDARSLFSIHSRNDSLRMSFLRPSETAGIGGHPGTRPDTALQMCALEQ